MAITFTPFSGGAVWAAAFTGATHTFSNLNGGTPFASGSKVVGVFSVDIGDKANFASSPTVGGNAMTRGAGNLGGATTSGLEIWCYDCTGSTTDSITVGNGTQFSRVGLVGGYLTGAATGAPGVNSEQQYGQQSTTQTLALTPVS